MSSDQEANTYYNIDIYNDNSTNGDISSKYSTSFNTPLLVKTNDYDVCVARARVPLDQIPLSQDNIPFQKWEIEIGVPTTGAPANTYTFYKSYVPQFNPITEPVANFTLGIATQNLYTTHLPENEPTTNPTLTLTSKSPALPEVVLPVTLDIGVVNTVFGSTMTGLIVNNHTINRYITATNVFVDTIDIQALFGLPNGVVLGMCMTPYSNNVYLIIHDIPTGIHYFCSEVDGAVSFVVDIEATGMPFELISMSSSGTFVTFGYSINGQNYVQSWSLNQVNHTTNISKWPQAGHVASFATSNHNLYVALMNDGAFYKTDPYSMDIITQTFTLPGSSFIERFLGEDIYGNLLIVVNNGLSNYRILAYARQSALLRYSIAMGSNRPLAMSAMIMGAGGTAYINNPAPYAVQSINDYIRQINLAFTSIFSQIVAPLTSPQLTPFLEFNSATSIISIVADAGCWSGTNPAGANPPCVINMNQLLWSFLKFNSIQALYTALPAVGGVVRTIEISKAIAPADTSTTPQPNSTIYRFSDLTRIVIGTSRMGVYGDVENNSKLLINIGDFSVDTEKGIPSLVIYNPTVLRFYKLYQTTPLTNIDIFISYANRAGEIFPVNISPYNSIGLKLLFKNRKLINQLNL